MNAAMIMMVEKSILGLDQIRVDAGGDPSQKMVSRFGISPITYPSALGRSEGGWGSEQRVTNSLLRGAYQPSPEF